MPTGHAVLWVEKCLGPIIAGITAMLAVAAPMSPAAAATPWAARTDTIFQTLATDQGFPTAVAFDTAMDQQGFLWVATGDGLVRWDGYRARIYHPKPRASGTLPGNFIQVVYADPQGTLWVGAAAGGLARYNQATDDFQAIGISGTANARVEIDAICDDGAGGLWIGGEGGLYHLNAGAGAMNSVVAQPKPAVPGHPDRVLALLRDKAGVIWAGTEAGLFRRDPSSLAYSATKLGDKPGAVTAVMQDGTGMVWAGTPGMGAFRVNADGSVTHQLTEAEGGAAPPIQKSDVYTIVEARPGEIWLGTASTGIVIVDEASLAMRHLRHDAATSTSLADDAVFKLYRDPHGLIWASTAHGISRANPGNTSILTMLPARDVPDSITDPDIDAMQIAPDGHIWLGLIHDGVNILDPASGHITTVPPSGDFPTAIVDAFAPDPSGGMYIGTWRGLFHADANGKSIRRIALPGTAPFYAVTGLAVTKDALWIGSSGLHRMVLNPAAPDGGVVEPVVSSDQLTDPRVRVLTTDGRGKIWIGTFDGINLFDPASGKIVQARADPADPKTLAPGLTTCLFIDNKQRLWVCTGTGLSLLTGKAANGTLIFHRLGVEDGLPNQSVDMLLQSKDGYLWASTDDGLARIDPDTLRIEAFHAGDGVVLPAYWNNSGAVAPDGHILFGGPGGLTIIDPDRFAARAPTGRIALSALWVGGKPVPEGQFNGRTNPAPLLVRPEANSIAFEFSALDLIDPGRLTYGYRLDGFDTSWVESDASRRLASYSNLPPRRYTLRIRSSARPGVWQDTALSVPITVLPAWYQTIWCRLAAAALTIAGILTVIRMQTLRLRGRQHELEKQIAQRTAELSTSNRELAHAASVLSDLGEIGQQITANLDIDTVFGILHEHVARLLDAPDCAIYLMRQSAAVPVLRFARWNGQPPTAACPDMAALQPHVLRTIAECQEIIVAPESGHSLICAPLVAVDRVIGVMLVQSPRPNAYGDQERLIFRTLCAYGAIALGNAETLAALADMRVQLEHLAYTDILTGLPNRRAYVERFERIAKGGRDADANCALLLIDVDRFKHINDNFGHDAGDALLAETARRLCEAVRTQDMVTRLGGDEFAIFICHIKSPGDVEQACARIAAKFDAAMAFETLCIQASVSIGVALFPEDGDTQEALYKAADQALYQAKRSGRNTWRRFTAVPQENLAFVAKQEKAALS